MTLHWFVNDWSSKLFSNTRYQNTKYQVPNARYSTHQAPDVEDQIDRQTYRQTDKQTEWYRTDKPTAGLFIFNSVPGEPAEVSMCCDPFLFPWYVFLLSLPFVPSVPGEPANVAMCCGPAECARRVSINKNIHINKSINWLFRDKWIVLRSKYFGKSFFLLQKDAHGFTDHV